MREGQEYPQCIKVHSSQKVATVGSVPYKSGEPQQCCNCSSKWHKRVQCLLEEEWWDLGDVSRSTSSEGSPELAPWDEEGKDANLKGHPRVPEDCSVPDSWRNPREGPCLHGCSWDQCSPHTIDETHNSNSDLHLHGEGSKNGCHLCVNCDCLNRDHEFGGPLNGSRLPGGYSRGIGWRRLGRGLPLTV